MLKGYDLLESVQHHATRIINGLKKVPYEERLRLMDLPTLSYRRLHGDATDAYKFRPVSGPGIQDLIWGPSSPGSQDQRHRVYHSIRSRQPGLDLGAFQSWQPEQHINFPVSVSPVILFHQPYSSQSIITCMPTSRMNCI